MRPPAGRGGRSGASLRTSAGIALMLLAASLLLGVTGASPAREAAVTVTDLEPSAADPDLTLTPSSVKAGEEELLPEQPDQASSLRLDRYRYDLRAFAADLVRTGYTDPDRARRLAYVAVSEAYRQGVPPALVFGVMRIENPWLRSTARSSAGAMGLMQVMPLHLPYLGKRYGYDLTNDATNLQMGIHILANDLRRKDGDWRAALLAYNGCVRGTRTPDCFSYPDKVVAQVESRGRYSCPSRDFDRCVVAAVREEFYP